jgi:4-hydroxy-tetrahydrodipicolinate reductase
MSLGVAALAKAIQSLETLKNFDFQVEEFHHSKKKDSPSGTAIFLQSKLEKTVGKKCPHPLSIRGGGIFGVHKIYAMSENEVLCFEHTALNRKLFADGAVTAAIWISSQKKGLYDIQDLIV